MDEKLTSFETFSRRKAEQDDAGRRDAARAGVAELEDPVAETERLVQRLDQGLKRTVSGEVGTTVGEDEIRALLRRYERASWHLHGDLRAILHGARKGSGR
jgi:hypothetical protein